MRKILIGIVALECLLLVGAAVATPLLGDRLQPPAPDPLVFEPRISSAVIGDSVRYRRLSAKDPTKELGLIEYKVERAAIIERSGMGPYFDIKMTQWDSDGNRVERRIRIQPELIEHGFLPPRFDELQRNDIPGGRPVIRSIQIALVPLRPGRAEKPGFVIEAVHPRDSLTKVKERYFIHPDVALFGVARWEREDEVLIHDRQNLEPRLQVPEDS